MNIVNKRNFYFSGKHIQSTKPLLSLLFIFLFCAVLNAQAPLPVGPIPNARQVEWYHREMIAFFHFGINTFTGTDGINEGDGKADPSLFNPTNLDCNQWMSVLKSAGIPCGILVAKHADGFCNWPSAYTDYSIKKSPWKNGNGNLVKEYTDACKTAGIKAGLYLGPHDRHQHLSPTYTTEAYSEYYASQLSELLRNYDTVWETWWDGAGADELTTPLYTRWADTVRTLQPNCIIFGTKNSNIFADVRWVGNESGNAGDPCWATINLSSIKNEGSHLKELNQGELNGDAYVPAESDVSIRPSWFYHSSEDNKVKTVKQLWDIYCNSVGHNSVLLLNLAPDRRGLIPSIDSANVAELRTLIDNTFKNNLASGAEVTALHPRGNDYSPSYLVDNNESTYYAGADEFTTDTLILKLNSAKTFDCLMIQEVIELGHRTTGWSVDYSTDGNKWLPIPNAQDKHTIGYKWIVRFNPIAATHIRLRITSGKACPAIHSFGIYKQPDEQHFEDGCSFYEDNSFSGNNITLNVGSYTKSDLENAGVSDNVISSISVPVGFVCDVFSEDNFNGERWSFNSDINDLGTISNCDNNISSIMVNRITSLTYKKPSYAGSSASGNEFQASNGNDGDFQTLWRAANNSLPQWWRVDLGGIYNITGSEIIWDAKKPYQYIIEASATFHFNLVFDNTQNTDSVQFQHDSFTADSVRYIKITITGVPEGPASFYEFNVFGAPFLTGVDNNDVAPEEYNLFQNYPNPFNPSTTIRYKIKNYAKVLIEIYDCIGCKVKTLIDDFQNPGLKYITWNGENSHSQSVASGIYFCKMIAGDYISTKKMLLLK